MNTVLRVGICVEPVVVLFSPLEEFNGNLLKESEGEKILILFAVRSNALLESRQKSGQGTCRILPVQARGTPL